MSTIVASLLRRLLRGIPKVSDKSGVPSQFNRIRRPVYHQTLKVWTSTHLPRKGKYLWSNLHSFCRNNGITDIRRKASLDFLRRNPVRFTLLSFVSLYMQDGNKNQTKANLWDCIIGYQEAFQYSLKNENDHDLPGEVESYEVGSRLGKPSCNGVVYEAKYNNKKYAMKILFNAGVPSDSTLITQKYQKEVELLHCPKRRMQGDMVHNDQMINHPSIIKVHQTFVDNFPLLYDAKNSYKSMLPRKYYKEGFGRNKTFFIVMEKCHSTLKEYLKENPSLDFEERFHILIQLVNAIGHLEKFDVAHRDIKCDNILLNFVDSRKSNFPNLVLTDFGDAFKGEDLLLRYDSYDISLGGNSALMAPEIITNISNGPIKDMVLDYSKADAWAVGAIAYEIFGKGNPFYETLQNSTYQDKDLPPINSGADVVDCVIHHLLKKNPDARFSASSASLALFLWKYAPFDFAKSNANILKEKVESWMLQLSIKVARDCTKVKSIEECPVELQHAVMFLSSRISKKDLDDALDFLVSVNQK